MAVLSTTKAIAEFEAANSNIKVKPEYGDISSYFDKLATQVAANDAPDVITMGGAYPAEYANRGALLIIACINPEVLFKRLTPEKAAEQSGSESKAAIGK